MNSTIPFSTSPLPPSTPAQPWTWPLTLVVLLGALGAPAASAAERRPLLAVAGDTMTRMQTGLRRLARCRSVVLVNDALARVSNRLGEATGRAHPITIVIDGPSGAGKGTAAKGVARRLGYAYVDTGNYYRALTLQAIAGGISASDGPALARLARQLPLAFSSRRGKHRVLLAGRDVTGELRSPRVTGEVAEVAAHGEVRSALLEQLSNLAATGRVVLDGRDLGTVVCPGAELKYFFRADPLVRAQRHWQELRDRGETVSLSEVAEMIVRKDQLDIARQHAPLRAADDAIQLDTTDLLAGEVIDTIVREARRRMRAPQPVRELMP